MSTPGGTAPVPYLQTGGGTVVDARSTVFHEFLNVVRQLVRKAGAFTHEDELNAALRHIDSYSRAVLNGDHQRVKREHDHAEVEDASLRIPPMGRIHVPAVGPSIDYERLAAAIIAAQQAAASQSQSPVHVVTDVPDRSQPSADQAAAGQPDSEPLF